MCYNAMSSTYGLTALDTLTHGNLARQNHENKEMRREERKENNMSIRER